MAAKRDTVWDTSVLVTNDGAAGSTLETAVGADWLVAEGAAMIYSGGVGDIGITDYTLEVLRHIVVDNVYGKRAEDKIYWEMLFQEWMSLMAISL